MNWEDILTWEDIEEAAKYYEDTKKEREELCMKWMFDKNEDEEIEWTDEDWKNLDGIAEDYYEEKNRFTRFEIMDFD